MPRVAPLQGRSSARQLTAGGLCCILLLTSTAASARPPIPITDEDGAATSRAGIDAPLQPDPPPRHMRDPNSPIRPKWDNVDHMAWVVATGTLKICEVYSRPLVLIPVAGVAASLAVQWACVLPAAVGVDYFQTFHGGRDVLLWESSAALVGAEIIRQVTQLPAVISLLGTALTSVVVVVAALATGGVNLLPPAVPEAYQPIALAGLVSGQALISLLLDAVRETLAYWTYRGIFGLFTDVEETRAGQETVQLESWMPADVDPLSRLWMLSSVSAGSRPDFSWWHVVPIAGRVVWALDGAETLQTRLRKIEKETLREPDEGNLLLDTTIYVVFGVDAALAALTDALIIVGLSSWALGTAVFFLAPPEVAAQPLYQQSLAVLGLTAVGLATAAAISVTVKDVRDVVTPWLVPIAFGAFPPSYVEAAQSFLLGNDDEEAPKRFRPLPPSLDDTRPGDAE